MVLGRSDVASVASAIAVSAEFEEPPHPAAPAPPGCVCVCVFVCVEEEEGAIALGTQPTRLTPWQESNSLSEAIRPKARRLLPC